MTSSLRTQPADLELIIFNFIRNHYETKHKRDVPIALKYLMLKFSNKIIGCKLLTMKEDLNFFKALSTKLPSIIRFNLLFRASDHKYSAAKFHKYCNDKGATISIIKSNYGSIFGGYTSKSWTWNDHYVKDKDAFLFLIKSNEKLAELGCPLLLELEKNQTKNVIGCYHNHGPIFGERRDVCIGDKCNRTVTKESDSIMVSWGQLAPEWPSNGTYCRQRLNNSLPSNVNICGGNVQNAGIGNKIVYFKVVDYEVFQLKRLNNS